MWHQRGLAASSTTAVPVRTCGPRSATWERKNGKTIKISRSDNLCLGHYMHSGWNVRLHGSCFFLFSSFCPDLQMFLQRLNRAAVGTCGGKEGGRSMKTGMLMQTEVRDFWSEPACLLDLVSINLLFNGTKSACRTNFKALISEVSFISAVLGSNFTVRTQMRLNHN